MEKVLAAHAEAFSQGDAEVENLLAPHESESALRALLAKAAGASDRVAPRAPLADLPSVF